jgi:hypothetical protein
MQVDLIATDRTLWLFPSEVAIWSNSRTQTSVPSCGGRTDLMPCSASSHEAVARRPSRYKLPASWVPPSIEGSGLRLRNSGPALAVDDLTDEDRELGDNLGALGAEASRQLRSVLTSPQPSRQALSRSLIGRPDLEPLAQLLAIADTDEGARLRLLRTLRDLGV